MKLDIGPKEARILKTILTNYLSDLRMEISNTERYELREAMKEEEDTVSSIIEQLEQRTTSSS